MKHQRSTRRRTLISLRADLADVVAPMSVSSLANLRSVRCANFVTRLSRWLVSARPVYGLELRLDTKATTTPSPSFIARWRDVTAEERRPSPCGGSVAHPVRRMWFTVETLSSCRSREVARHCLGGVGNRCVIIEHAHNIIDYNDGANGHHHHVWHHLRTLRETLTAERRICDGITPRTDIKRKRDPDQWPSCEALP